MIRIPEPAPVDVAPPAAVGPLSVHTVLHHLQSNDVFEFVDSEVREVGTTIKPLPAGRLRVSVKPWGPKTPVAGPIGPWMFACRDTLGVERHLALPPRLAVRLLERVAKS